MSAATGAVSLGFMKRDMDATADHAAAEALQSSSTATSTTGLAALDAAGATERLMAATTSTGTLPGGGLPTPQARPHPRFKHHLLQVLPAPFSVTVPAAAGRG